MKILKTLARSIIQGNIMNMNCGEGRRGERVGERGRVKGEEEERKKEVRGDQRREEKERGT